VSILLAKLLSDDEAYGFGDSSPGNDKDDETSKHIPLLGQHAHSLKLNFSVRLARNTHSKRRVWLCQPSNYQSNHKLCSRRQRPWNRTADIEPRWQQVR
jgi:hypothetical protein